MGCYKMPKIIELTVEIDVQRVSCPGVWLCQDGRVSLTVYALGTRYQTGMLPPQFPLTFRDVFYFQVSCPGVWLCQDGRVSLTVYALGTRYQTGMLPPQFPLTFRDVFYFQVSCPGVWLCQDGRVSLTVYALGTRYQTGMLPPQFPLTFRDVFYFQVSCPGVWLCQDGRVSLTVYALGTRYQTGMLPPQFPLTFRDVFYFQVSCPGVWLCQDGRVSLTVYALGTRYQTGMLPPQFPLMFRDVFYFQVSCPGVWLCQDGRVSLTVYALGTRYQTGMLPPQFPLTFRDVFYFQVSCPGVWLCQDGRVSLTVYALGTRYQTGMLPPQFPLTFRDVFYFQVSCPGVWLCQDGRVSLTVYALGTRYQTGMLPPQFPLTFRDVFYFRKRFQETCALNNICCLLKEETIYCELVQWSQDCISSDCVVLAQYLGSLNDVLFPPNMCSSDGVDLLMRRCKEFPGILSPKIEIATKVRIDEVWNEPCSTSYNAMKVRPCHCATIEGGGRQKPVCHSAQYHRTKCPASPKREPSETKLRSRSRSRSGGSRSLCSLQDPRESKQHCGCPNPTSNTGVRSRSPRRERRARSPYCVYNVAVPKVDSAWRGATNCANGYEREDDFWRTNQQERDTIIDEDRHQKVILESRYIDENRQERCKSYNNLKLKRYEKINIKPCVCEICKRYHELFHSDCKS